MKGSYRSRTFDFLSLVIRTQTMGTISMFYGEH